MEKSNIEIDKTATEKLLQGVDVASSAIRLAYGAGGCNSIIENELPPYHTIVNDADTIIQSIQLKEPIKNRGLALLKELSAKANADSGDGRKTTCILADVLLKEGFVLDMPLMTIKKELDKFIDIIESEIDKLKTNLDIKDIYKVATIASESTEIGNILNDIYKKTGRNGIIHVEGSGTYTSSIEYIEGVRFEQTGYLSPYMVKRDEKTVVYKKPTILVTKKRISNVDDINPLLSTMNSQNKKDLVIFTDDMDSSVASLLIDLHVSGKMNVLIIKAPVLWKNYIFEDFAKCVGATIVEDSTGINFKNLKLEHLGTCNKIITSKEDTILIGTSDLSSHINDLKEQRTEDSKLRLSWLVANTAILKLGANSESELSYKMLKTKDAINSCRLALKDGVIPGGGTVLRDIADKIEDSKVGNIVKKALRAPLKQNLHNMGIEFPQWGDEVIDSSIVIKNAVRNAIGLASTVLTTKIVINSVKKEVDVKSKYF